MKNIFALTLIYFLFQSIVFALPNTKKSNGTEVIKVEQYEKMGKLSKKEKKKLRKEKRKLSRKEKVISFFEKIFANTPLTIGLSALVLGGLLAVINHFLFLSVGIFTWVTIGLLLGGLFFVVLGLMKKE